MNLKFFENIDNKWYLIVSGVLFLVFGAVAVFDIILSRNGDIEDNLNYQLHDWSNGKYYFIPFFWGVVVGHLFFGTKEPWINMTTGIVSVAIITVGIIILGYFKPLKKEWNLTAIRLSLLAIGMIYGHFLWSMNYIEKDFFCIN